MKASAFLRKSAKKNDTNSQATIYFRLRDKGKDFKAASELTINPNHWNPEKQGYKDRVALISDEKKIKLNDEIQNIISLITNSYNENVDAEWLSEMLDRYHHPNKYKTAEQIVQESKPTFHQLLDEFLLKHKLSEVRKKNFRVICRAMMRYELFVRETKRGQKSFALDIDTVTADTLYDMWDFFENEHIYYEKYPAIYEQIPEKRTPQPRGKNTLIDCFCRIRTFFLWCHEKKKTANRPFDQFRIDECTYGTPVYITLQERNKLYEKYKEAISDFTKAIDLDDEYSEAYNNRGTVYYDLRDDENFKKQYPEGIKLAIADYAKAIKIDENYVEAYINRGIALTNRQDYTKAISDFQKAIDKKRDSFSAYYNWGILLMNQQKYGDVIDSFLKTIELYKKHSEAYDQCLQSYFNLQNQNVKSEYTDKLSKAFIDGGKTVPELLALYKSDDIKDIVISMLARNNNEQFNQIMLKYGISDKNKIEKYINIYFKSFEIMRLLRVNSEEKKNGIAHYTKKSTAAILLFSKEKRPKFRFYSTVTANDPSEGDVLLKCLRINNIENNNKRAFYASFTFNYDCLNQFRLYGKENNKEATGVSMVFKPKFFCKSQSVSFNLKHDRNDNKNADNYMINPPLFRCLYIDPETKQVMSLGTRENYSFYKEKYNYKNLSKSDVDGIEANIQIYNQATTDRLVKVRKKLTN